MRIGGIGVRKEMRSALLEHVRKYIDRRKFKKKLPTIWRVEKHSSRVVKPAERRCNSAKVRRKKIHPSQMLEKSRNAVLFQ